MHTLFLMGNDYRSIKANIPITLFPARPTRLFGFKQLVIGYVTNEKFPGQTKSTGFCRFF
jgi:hypothetical protein